MKKKRLPSFFEVEPTLHEEEIKELAQFARSPRLRTGKKAIQLLELLPKVPKSRRNTEQKINWLIGKLYPKDADDRRFRRAAKQAEEVFWNFLAYRKLEEQNDTRYLLILEELLERQLPKQFKLIADKLSRILEHSSGDNALRWHRAYCKEDLMRKQQMRNRQVEAYELNRALEQLDHYYLLEKLKYAIHYLQLGNVRRDTQLPEALREKLEFLHTQHQAIIAANPVLSAFSATYSLFLEGETEVSVPAVLRQLEQNKNLVPKEELHELYNLLANFLIHKINTSKLPYNELKATYQDYFRLNLILLREGLLLEGEHIPYKRFQNVVASALNTGQADDIKWAESFLDNNLHLVLPEDREPLEHFCRGAICFYNGAYEQCLQLLRKVPFNNRFYYCDIKSLEIRVQYEQPQAHTDYFAEINNAVRVLRKDRSVSIAHQKAYLNFFSCLKQLMQLRELDRPDKEKLAQLKCTVEETKHLAQKKWLLEKVFELEQQ